ncbi:hypothetical protein BLA24_17515 [Streptomyces cinnamoneus]|uniref:Integral membrane protein n=1 Tax=Streptomyces cinnamoneus TaxID=53446 RepID=A0A2G1XH96_STRCJ|nr:hypothetical protein [Streptomyces cinnamoneus]PHQ50600.1 hypothetical protein BLA24_17515 [Streptomyces cinnamoneus]PPT14145.1 hypothetical protein CYQ11_15760 [Streptomyces cinnamoneus]
MPHPVARAGADLRLIRAAVFTAVCVLLSAGGHVLASCASVPLWTLGAAFLLVFAVAVALAGRERSLPGIAACLAVGQLALHTLFGLAQQHPAAPRRAGAEGHLIDFAAQLTCNQPRAATADEARRVIIGAGFDPAVHPMAAGVPAGGPQPSGNVLAHLLPLSLPMLLGHLLAAVAVGWLLRRGEATLWRVLELSADSARGVAEAALVQTLGALLLFVRPQVPDRPAVSRRGAHDDERPAREPVLQHFVIRRGPPRFALAA